MTIQRCAASICCFGMRSESPLFYAYRYRPCDPATASSLVAIVMAVHVGECQSLGKPEEISVRSSISRSATAM